MELVSELMATCSAGLLLCFFLLVIANNLNAVARQFFLIIRSAFPWSGWDD
jgi:hypothetical protein